MSKNTIDPAPNPSCFAFLAACLASVIPSSFAPDWRVEASRPLANSTNPNPCASNALFFPVHVLCVSLGGAVSQYPENENVLRSTGRAASPGYSFRSNPKYTFLSAGTLTLLSCSNGELGRAARADSSATMMVKLVAVRFIRKDYHYVLVNAGNRTSGFFKFPIIGSLDLLLKSQRFRYLRFGLTLARIPLNR